VTGVVLTSDHDGGSSVGRGADVEQPERIGHHRAVEDGRGVDLGAVSRVRVVSAVARVLDLDGGEVVGRGAVEVHAPPCVQGEVHGIGGADQVEAQPVGVSAALAADRGEEALGRGVGTDHEGDVAEAGEDLGAGGVQRRRTRRAGGVARRDAAARPAELLGEGGTGDEAGIAVADRVGTGDVLNVPPRHAGVGQRGAGRHHPVLGEVAAPLAPWVHASAQHDDVVFAGHHAPPLAGAAGAHTHTR